MLSSTIDYTNMIEIDKRINQLNQEVTHINKILKHYADYKKCLSQNPDQTFLEYIYAKKDTFIDERNLLIERRNKIIANYQNMEES